MTPRLLRAAAALCVVVPIAMLAMPARAASSGAGSGFGLSANLSTVPLLGSPTTLTLGPAPSGVSGSAPPEFNKSGSTVSVSGSLFGGAATVGTGVLDASTQSMLYANSVTSSASVDNLNLALTILGLTAQAVTSSANAICTAGSVALSGSSHLVGVSEGGLLLGVSIDAFPAPNTVILNVLGVKVTLNEQIHAGNQLTVNAIHVALNNALLTGLGLLSGDIYVSRSVASMADCALPDLAMSKSGPSTATVGTPFDYVLSLANVGGLATSGTISVADTIAASLAINSVTPGANFNCGANGQVVTCTSSAPIGAGASNVIVATIDVTPQQPGPTSNTAVVSGGGDNAPANNTSPPVLTQVGPAPKPDLTMSKTAPNSVTVGTAFDYALALANVGTGPTSGTITVTDPVPASLVINNVTPGPNFSCGTQAQTVTCTSNVAIGAGTSNVPVATIHVTPTQAGPLSNIAVVSGGGDDTPANNPSPPAQTQVSQLPVPDLSAAKSGPGTATVGVAFDYQISVSNTGNGPTSGTITVTDPVPAGLTINGVTPGAGFACGTSGQTVTCTSASVIASGASSVVVASINVTPTQAGSVGNTATVSGGGDNSPGNNTSPPVNTTVNAAPVPDLAMSKSGPGTATVGTAFSYTLTLANVGTGPTSGTVTVSDVVPAGLTINGVTNGAGFNCNAAGQTVTCSTGTAIPNGASGVAVATISVTPTAAGPVSNTATVSGGGDNSPGNNTSPPVNTAVSAAPVPDLAIAMTGPSVATVGTPFDYVITLSNVGNAPTNGAFTVGDTIPAGLAITHVDAGPDFQCAVNAQTVTCTRTTPIAAGASGVPVATITVTPTAVGAISDTSAVSGGGDNAPANNVSPPVNTTVSAAPVPDLVMGKSGPASATVGTAFNYVLTLSNAGTGATSGQVSVSDSIAASLAINSVSAGANFSCGLSGQTVNCSTSAPIGAGTMGLVVATVNVTPTAAGPVSNTAVASGGGDNSPANNTSPPVNTTVSAAPAPDLTIQMTGPSAATVGTPFDYVVTVSNVGTAPTSGPFSVTDTIPNGLAITNVAPGPGFTCGVVAQTVTCTRSAVLPPGATNAPAVTITVTPNGVGAVSNTSTIGGGGDNSPANNASPPINTAVSATPVPDLEMRKSGPPTATVGVSFAYTLSLANTGTGPTAGTITVVDVVAAGLAINGVSAGPGFACATNGHTVTCTSAAAIAAGAQNVSVATINVTPTDGGTTVSNIAAVSGGGDNSPGNNVSPPVNTAIGTVAVPDLSISKSGPRVAEVGVEFGYLIEISNVGTAATQGTITVTDPVPAGLAVQSVVAADPFSCGVAGQTVTCTTTASIPPGAIGMAVVTINVMASGVGSMQNIAIVDGGGDSNAGNNASPPVATELVVGSRAPVSDAARPIPTLSPLMILLTSLLVALIALLPAIGRAKDPSGIGLSE